MILIVIRNSDCIDSESLNIEACDIITLVFNAYLE
jgi:hypothetical protein